MKLRRWVCFLLCLVLTVCLCTPALADGELFFVAVNDTIPLTLSVFPTYSGGTLYVPYQVFDSQPCGVTPSYNQTKQTYVLLSRTRQMIFDLAAGTVSDESGSVSTANVLYRGGILYLPLTFCASHFGLKTTMLESAGGYQILRFTDGSEVYDDSLFVEKAENLIAYRVRQSQSGSQPQEKPTDRPNNGAQGTQEQPATEKKPATVYLAFTGSETMRDSMAALETYNLHGTFFLTEAEIRSDPSLILNCSPQVTRWVSPPGRMKKISLPRLRAQTTRSAPSPARKRSSRSYPPMQRLPTATAPSTRRIPRFPQRMPPLPKQRICSSALKTPKRIFTLCFPPRPTFSNCSKRLTVHDSHTFAQIFRISEKTLAISEKI